MCMQNANYDYYIETNFSNYAGKWIGIFERKVVIAGKTFKEVAEFIDQHFPKNKVLIAHIPLNQAQMLLA